MSGTAGLGVGQSRRQTDTASILPDIMSAQRLETRRIGGKHFEQFQTSPANENVPEET